MKHKITRFLKVPSEIKKRDLEKVEDALREQVHPGQYLPINGGNYVNRSMQVRSIYNIEDLLQDIPSCEAYLVDGNALKTGSTILMFLKDDFKPNFEYMKVHVYEVRNNASELGGYVILGSISNRVVQIYIYNPLNLQSKPEDV